MVADPHGSGVLTSVSAAEIRYGQVSRVLYQVLFLNLAVAFAKIALGTYTGAVSIVSDGFHSLTDSASNVVGLVGISIARQPPDAEHPYGHRKYETMASVAILIFLILVLVEVVSSAAGRVINGGTPKVFPEGIALMTATLGINLFVVAYEKRAGKRLNSELLLADSMHTRSDVLTTIAVIGALLGVWAGYPLLDPMAALLVAAFIGHACWEIAQQASRILSDQIVIAEEDVRTAIAGVPGVLGCEKIRTRGSKDYAFLDLHLWLDGDTPLVQAHARSHVVKDLLMARFPQLADVVIHIEPPPLGAAPPTR
ncbi:MAG TPA: cation diffusion facilitator family transporter [Vicinamibacterales bacterium]|nr:cation diffusion facilitator family transporter [Vicinamibacterales bacterium]